MDTQEMIRRSGLVSPPTTAALLARASKIEPLEPVPAPAPKPAAQPPAPQSVATASGILAQSSEPPETIAVADLRKFIAEIVDERLQAMLDANPEEFRGPQGISGRDGKDGRDAVAQDGKDGAPGKDATVAVGGITIAPPGSPASVTNVGSPNAAVLNFVLPRGADGESIKGERGEAGKILVIREAVQGPKGDKGDSIIGPVGPSGLDEEQITALVLQILTDVRVVSEHTTKLLGLEYEIDDIAKDPNLQRLGSVKDRLVSRLRERLK